MVTKLPWLLRMRRELPRITFGNYARPGETIEELAGRMARLLDPAMSWADVTRCAPSGRGRSFLKASYTPLKPQRPWRVASMGWWSQTMAGGSSTALRAQSTHSRPSSMPFRVASPCCSMAAFDAASMW